jgi:hypothetical protein
MYSLPPSIVGGCLSIRNQKTRMRTKDPPNMEVIHNRSDFCIRQILGKKYEYNEAVYQVFIDFKNAYNSVRREVLYIEWNFGLP